MATAEQVASLREMIHEPNQTPYNDDYLKGIIDTSASLETAAETMWLRKASTFADLVDVREGASSRSLGNLHKQALEMARVYADQAAGDIGGVRYSTTRPIVRKLQT